MKSKRLIICILLNIAFALSLTSCNIQKPYISDKVIIYEFTDKDGFHEISLWKKGRGLRERCFGKYNTSAVKNTDTQIIRTSFAIFPSHFNHLWRGLKAIDLSEYDTIHDSSDIDDIVKITQMEYDNIRNYFIPKSKMPEDLIDWTKQIVSTCYIFDGDMKAQDIALSDTFTYTNSDYGFSLDLPLQWQVMLEDKFPIALMFMNPIETEYQKWAVIGDVIISPYDIKRSLDDLQGDLLLEHNNDENIEMLDFGKCDDARWCIYTATDRAAPDKELLKKKFFQYITTTNRDMVIITCSSLPEKFETSRPVFESICKSFKPVGEKEYIAIDANSNTLSLTLDSINWSLDIPLKGFDIKPDSYQVAKGGKAIRFFSQNDQTGIVISGFLEKAAKKGDSKVCRDYFRALGNKAPFVKSDIKIYELGDIAFTEHMVEKYSGRETHQKNMNAYLSHSGYWIDIHISKMNYQDEDMKLFKAITESIMINEK